MRDARSRPSFNESCHLEMPALAGHVDRLDLWKPSNRCVRIEESTRYTDAGAVALYHLHRASLLHLRL